MHSSRLDLLKIMKLNNQWTTANLPVALHIIKILYNYVQGSAQEFLNASGGLTSIISI